MILCFFVMGCAGPGYYWQAASGHMKLMRDRQDVGEVLADPETDPNLAQRLQTAAEILQFAEAELDLPAAESYRSYVETGRDAVVWNVVATPEFSLVPKKWCFPVAGCGPYRGYFEQEKAERFAARLRQKGLDVAVTPATAYSTLGWFDDPLMDTMLRGPETRLAGTIFHELAHARLYVKGDTTFNESYAAFVERAGVRSWLGQDDDQDVLDEWLRIRRAVSQFHALLSSTRDKLSDLYASGKTEQEMRDRKQGVFGDLKRDYDTLREQKWQGRDYFSSWFSTNPGNARLALHQSYEGGICVFDRLFRELGKSFPEFHGRAELLAEMDTAERRSWMNESCQPIASGHDL